MIPSKPMMTDTRTEAIRALLAARVRYEPEIRRYRMRRRIFVWGGIGVLGTAALTTGAALLFQAAPVTDMTIVHCLSSMVPSADGTYPGSSATIAADTGPGHVDDALALCGQMWQQGILGNSVDPVAPTQGPEVIKIPPLQVCVMRDGTAAVVPSDVSAVCQSLGMSSLKR